MFKIKYMNYKPYQYELLEKDLNELGKDGYDCDDLSLISVFKKKDYPVHYKVEFYQSKEKEKYKQHKDIAKYYEKHTEFGYYPIYGKNHMYVFSGKDNYDFKKNTYSDLLKISDRRASNCFLLMSLFLFGFISLFYLLFLTQSVTAFLTYGKPIAYIGILLLVFYFVFNYYNEFRYTNKLKDGLPDINVLKKNNKISIIILLLSIVMIAGGLIEDSINNRSFTNDEHSYIVLSDLGFNEDTEINTSARNGFIIKDSYYINEFNDSIGLVTNEYNFSNSKQALSFIDSLIEYPSQVISTKIEKVNDLYYGYYEDSLNTIIIINNDNKVIILTCSEVFNDEMINTVTDFYK